MHQIVTRSHGRKKSASALCKAGQHDKGKGQRAEGKGQRRQGQEQEWAKGRGGGKGELTPLVP